MSPRSLAAVLILLGLGLAMFFATAGWSGRNPQKEYRRALEALGQGDLRDVAAAAEMLQRHPGYEPHVALLDGAILLRRGDLSGAWRKLQLPDAQAELRLPTLLLRGECLYHLGRLGEAQDIVQKLAEEYPENPDGHRWLGAIYYDLGANDLAIAELKKVVELEPDDYRPHRLMGLMYHDFEEDAEAIEHYRKALALSPPADVREQILRELGEALVAERKYNSALEVLDDAEPDVRSLVLQSECYWSLGDQEQADRTLKRARSLDPDDRSLLYLQARMLKSERKFEEAIAKLQRALKLDPHDAECRYQLALIYRQLGKPEEYETHLQKWRTSKELFDRLTELNIEAISRPQDAEIRDELAEICHKLGKEKLAEMWRQAAAACRQGSGARGQGSGVSDESLIPHP